MQFGKFRLGALGAQVGRVNSIIPGLITAGAGSYSWSGDTMAPIVDHIMPGGAGSYAWTGQDASFLRNRLIAGAAGSYAWTGQDATLSIGSGFTPASLSPSWWFEAGKGGLFQSNAGSTAATANSDVVGYAPDQSGNGFTLTSQADDTTRPTLQGVGTFPYLSFDGSNDCLRRLAALDGWNAGSTTWCFTFRSNSNAVSTYVAASGNSASTNTIFTLLKALASPATSSGGLYRDDSGAVPTNAPNSSSPTNTNVFDGNDHVILITDSGNAINVYVDGVLGTGIASYTHSGTFTLDRFAIGALWRTGTAPAAGTFWAGRIYGAVVIDGHVVDATERANLTTYMGALAGLSL